MKWMQTSSLASEKNTSASSRSHRELLGLRRVSFSARTVPLALLAVCALFTGLMAGQLSFYQDDWYTMWFARSFGPQVFFEFFSYERPVLAVTYAFFTALLGQSALVWQLFAVLGRWVAALSVWWSLRQIWPQHSRQAAWTAFVFALYPGFQQQYISVLYSQAFLLMAAQIASLGWMGLAIHRPDRYRVYTALGVLSLVYAIFSTEYYFGQELLRPLFIWFMLGAGITTLKDRLWAVLRCWAPYLAVTVLFFVWRVFIFRFPTYQPVLAQDLEVSPATTLVQLARTVLQDVVEVAFLAWEPLWEPLRHIEAGISRITLLSLAISAAAALLLVLYLAGLRLPGTDRPEGRASWGMQAALIGFTSLFVMGIPYWFVNLRIELQPPGDRLTLSFMLGVSLLVVGLIDLLVRTPLQKAVIVGLLVALSGSFQVRIANSYRLVHQAHKNFFQQLTWRVPQLEPGTVLVANSFPYPYSGDSSFMAVVNWLYDRQVENARLDYYVFYLPERLGKDLLLSPGYEIHKEFRGATFQSSTDQMLVLHYDNNACLRVLDGRRDAHLPGLPADISDAQPFSRLDRIRMEQDTAVKDTLERLFGPEENSSWCYYYQKAELARQVGDWQMIADLGDQAGSRFKEAYEKGEYLPFIEGYARVGRFEDAYQLTRQVAAGMANPGPTLCELWDRVEAEAPADETYQPMLAQVREDLDCSLIQVDQQP